MHILSHRLLLVVMTALLTACAYPVPYRESGSFDVRYQALDARFPGLAAYSMCDRPCPKGSRDYIFAYLQKIPPSDNPEFLSVHYYARSFQGALGEVLVPSFSEDAQFRVLDTYDYSNTNGDYFQMLAFYHNTPGARRHVRLVNLGQTACKDPKIKAYRSSQTREIRQKISFAIILQSRVYLFLEPPAEDPACADSSIRKVLGEVRGMPTAWKDRPMVVYTAELALTPSELAEERPETRARRIAGDAAAPVRPRGPVTVSEDPVPPLAIGQLPVAFTCIWHTVGNDWEIYLGMSAKRRTEMFNTFSCGKPES